MTRMVAGALTAAWCGVAIVAGSAFTAAPAQRYPGEPTQAKVWIENRSRTEAIPISVQDIGSDTVMNVRVMSTPPVQVAGSVANASPVTIAGSVDHRRQRWEYQVLVIRPGQDVAAELNRAGADSWETSGSATQDATGMTFVMKRPR
jgi:hypothetical protein